MATPPAAGRTGLAYYDCMDVPTSASQEDVKKAYKKLAVRHHPDKGGDPRTFKQISQAYQVLSDPDQRRLYDQLGDEHYAAAASGGGAGSPFGDFSPFDMFAQMFGGGGGPFGGPPPGMRHPHQRDQQAAPNGAPQPQQPSVHTYKLVLTLDDAYRGVTKKINVSEESTCKLCEQVCRECGGAGFRTTILQMGFMTQVAQAPCGACQGRGVTVARGNKGCKLCAGAGSVKDTKTVDIRLPGGIETNANIGVHVSDTCELVIRVSVSPHDALQRRGSDLVYVARLTLQEAIMGKALDVPHFDGPVRLDTTSLGVVRHGQEHVIAGRGMPILSPCPNHGPPQPSGRRGCLVIAFEVMPLTYGGGSSASAAPVILPTRIRAAFFDAFMLLERYINHVRAGGDPADDV